MKGLIRKILLFVLVAGLIAFVVQPDEAFAKRKARRIVFEDAVKIKGRIIRPELSLIIQRSKVNFDALKLKESFLPRIVRSVKQEPF